ncbi:P-type ATPase-like protein [Calycina marina]|uniref:P-type ATPase-like protein n=1 Tax=Calycina marina TaxID=1763456 RepID=A0A9P8CFE7_9HELO|nr:P-type ATPase-like protein [Calycina marina]
MIGSPVCSTSVDIEMATQKKHVLINIEGMDCSGCERKLWKSLAAFPELTNVKTSFLLAQAEFDFMPSKSVHHENILSMVERKTGFKCSIWLRGGAQLDLLVEGDLSQYSDDRETRPKGVTKVLKVSKRCVQVSYLPQVVSARDLLLNPFFKGATLAPAIAPPLIASGRKNLKRTFWMTLLSVVLTIPVLGIAWGGHLKKPVLYGLICLSLATIIQVFVAMPFYINGFKSLVFSRIIDMDLLIVLSSSTAYIYSVVAFVLAIQGKDLPIHQFFETSTLLVTLIMVGRTLSAFAQQKAIESIATESLQPQTAILCGLSSQTDKEIDSRLLHYGDIIKVLPDMSVATDGIVISGESEVDESLLTGEASLIVKRPGDKVLAGSINHHSNLAVEVTRLPSENTIQSICDLIDEAKATKPKVQDLADQVASWFVPVILATTCVVFAAWVVVGMAGKGHGAAESCINAMTFAMTVLIVSCPCAIGLAVPMVVLIAGGVAARNGLVFKNAETINVARRVSHVVFDKTGTLTRGNLSVVSEKYPTGSSSLPSSLAFALVTNSTHPVSKAIAVHFFGKRGNMVPITNFVSVPGKGIEAIWNNQIVRAGNPYWLQVQHHPIVKDVLSAGATVLCICIADDLVAVFGLRDDLRIDALETIHELRQRSIAVSVVSGDNEQAVRTTAAQLGIAPSEFRCRYTPEEKQQYIKSLIESRKDATVLFVGDGTNDAPSLAQASIGLHISEGTDVASSAADVILMRSSLRGVITLIDLSKAYHRRVVFNFAWSFVYNLLAVLLAAGAFSVIKGARIPPQYAGLGEVVSVVPVVVAAMGLRCWKG